MIVDPVTARYADALYRLAHKKQAQAQIARDVAALSAEIARPATRALLFNPRVEREAKRAQLGPVLANTHPLVRNLVNLLLDKNREGVLRHLKDAFQRLLLEERGTIEGVVESARPLAPAEIERVAATLGARLGKQLVLENRIVPGLVGGARVTAAHRMIDFSVQGRLEGLRRRMMDVRLPTTA